SFLYIAPCSSVTYTLSLHDALPISVDIDTLSPVDRHIVGGGDQLPGYAVEHIKEAVLRGLHQHPAHPAADLEVREDDVLSGVERSEEHTSELQSLRHLVCRLLLEKT